VDQKYVGIGPHPHQLPAFGQELMGTPTRLIRAVDDDPGPLADGVTETLAGPKHDPLQCA
jgi:hypothetical protein